MCHPPQADDCGQAREAVEPRIKELATGADFGRRRLVFRRNTANGIGDHAINQFKAVVWASVESASGKTECTQCAVKKVAGVVTGEGATGPIGAFQSRCKTDNEQACVVGPK